MTSLLKKLNFYILSEICAQPLCEAMSTAVRALAAAARGTATAASEPEGEAEGLPTPRSVVAPDCTVILICHRLSFLRDLHTNLAVIAVTFCQNASVTPGLSVGIVRCGCRAPQLDVESDARPRPTAGRRRSSTS